MDNTKQLDTIIRLLNKSGINEVMFPTTTVGTVDANSNALLVDTNRLTFGNMNMQVTWTGFSTTDATVKLQSSNDGSNWIDVTDSTITLNAASGTLNVVAAYAASQYVRVVFAKGTNAAGTFGVILSIK